MSGTTDNRHYIEKADHSLAALTSGGGELLPEKAAEFWKLALKPTVILKETGLQTMSSFERKIPKAAFLSRVLRPGVSGQALSEADRAALAFSQTVLTVKEFKAETHIPYDVMEDNILQDSFQDFVMNELSRAIGRDMEEIVCNGDTSQSADLFLKQFNGIRKLTTTNTADLSNAGTAVTIDSPAFLSMLQAHPVEYLEPNRKDMRFYTSTDAELMWRSKLGTRATVAGDRYVLEDAPAVAYGVPVVGVPWFPDNLGVGTNETEIIFTNPKNVIVGVWKTVKLKSRDEISAGEYHVVGRVRFGMVYNHEPAASRGYGIKKS